MHTNDYFRDHSPNHYPSQPNQSYAYSPYDSQSPYITPTQSHDRLNAPSQIKFPSPNDRPSNYYGDPIPLKQTAKIQTNPSKLPHPSTHDLPSPESGTPTELMPDRQRRRRRHKKKKEGFFSGRIPWVVYIMTLVQLTVFIYEIIKNSILTGSPIMIKPQFNPMIGPSTYVLINTGARFVPCMRTTLGLQDSSIQVAWPCPNTTTTDSQSPSNQCSLADVCGFSDFDFKQPNQWFRFILPIFLHAGVIHIGFNMLLQLTMGREMEKTIGSVRFALVYFSSGIFGFVLGGNFAPPAIASTGASGCLFGVLALVLLDLLYTWDERRSPGKELVWILIDIAISLVLGLLPGLDNFSHIGGFLMGLGAGVCILHSPNQLRHKIDNVGPYRNVEAITDATMMVGAPPESPKRSKKKVKAQPADFSTFVKQPVGFFKNRKPLWWAWWLIRAGALIGVTIAFIVLLTNFYKYRVNCGWCKYLSCINVKNWCEIGNLQLNTTQNNRRELLRNGATLVTDLWDRAGIS